MAAPTYNLSGTGGLPTISPQADLRLRECVVLTTAREPAVVRSEYGLPGLSGRGSRTFGLEAGDIRWDLTFLTTMSDLRAFESDLRRHAKSPVRATLQAERANETWDYVELAAFERTELRPVGLRSPGITEYWVSLVVRFRWMQP